MSDLGDESINSAFLLVCHSKEDEFTRDCIIAVQYIWGYRSRDASISYPLSLISFLLSVSHLDEGDEQDSMHSFWRIVHG